MFDGSVTSKLFRFARSIAIRTRAKRCLYSDISNAASLIPIKISVIAASTLAQKPAILQ